MSLFSKLKGLVGKADVALDPRLRAEPEPATEGPASALMLYSEQCPSCERVLICLLADMPVMSICCFCRKPLPRTVTGVVQ